LKAIVRYTYGSPDLLELRDIDIPEYANEEVLVRVHAAGVGRDVWHIMTGLPDTPRWLRLPRAQEPRHRLGRGRGRGGGRQECKQVPAR
jgi:NADPH:quinone reductase-like Zn-dependent oxidoreductase